MKKTPLITIGMAAYNGDQFITKSIASLLSQSYPHFELIISNDASTDRTDTICRQFSQKDKRIRYIQQEKNKGFRKNFNFVLNEARGEYFMWASSDDFWHKDFISTLLNLLLDNPDAVLAMGNFENIKDNIHYKNKASTLGEKTTKFSSLLNFIKNGDVSYYYGLHKTKNLLAVGGYLSSSRPFFKSSDYLTIFKVLLGGRMVFTNATLFYKRDTGLFIDRFTVLKRLQLDRNTRSKIARYACFPLFFVYDMITSTKYLFTSHFSMMEKFILWIYLLNHFIYSNVRFFLDAILGFFYLFEASFQKIFHRV